MISLLTTTRKFLVAAIILSLPFSGGCNCTQDEEIRISENLVDESRLFSNNSDMIYDNSRKLVQTSGQESQAIERLSKRAKAVPGDTIILNNLAFEYYKAGRSAEALSTYSKILEIDPSMATAHNNIGLVYFQMGERDKAIDCFRKCISCDPSFVQAYASLGLLHFRKNETAEAVRLLNQSLETNEVLVASLEEKLKAARDASLGTEILKNLENELASQKANDALAHNNLGLVFYETREFEKADLHFTRALDIDPSIDVALYNIAKIAIAQKKWTRAKEMATRYLAVRPDNLTAQTLLREIEDNLVPAPNAEILKIPMAPQGGNSGGEKRH